MALAPTLYDFDLAFSDPDRRLALQLKFKTARHPSETFARVWLRVLAYCWRYEERLEFGPGLSDTEAPDLLATDLTGRLTQWIRVGKSEPGKIQRAVDQHPEARVSVLFESTLRQEQFLAEARGGNFSRLAKAQLAGLDPALVEALAGEDLRRVKATVTLVAETFYVDLGAKPTPESCKASPCERAARWSRSAGALREVRRRRRRRIACESLGMSI